MPSPWDSIREQELRREIRDHLDLEAEAGQDRGLSPDEARRAARVTFGNPDNVREDVREAWGWRWLERLAIDVRHAIRLWGRNPGFSTIAVATVAIGIGASTALFSQIPYSPCASKGWQFLLSCATAQTTLHCDWGSGASGD